MSEPTDIGKSVCLKNLTKYAERVKTEDGNVYYRFPHWFQEIPGDFRFVIHTDLPEDLSQFITKSGLGGDNPKPTKPEL